MLACGDTIAPVAAPVVRIIEPTADAMFRAGDTVLLRATLEGDAAVSWYADQASVAVGLTAVLPVPDPGTIVITAVATSPEGLEGRDRQVLEVLPNGAPLGTGIFVLPSVRAYDTDSLALIATGVDVENGGALGSVTWYAGTTMLGNGDTVRIAPGGLSIGTHQVRAILRDPQGLADSLDVTVTIVAAPNRLRWVHTVPTGSASRSLLALRPDGVILAALGTAQSDCRYCLVAVSPTGNELWRASITTGWGPPTNHSGALTIAPGNTSFVMDMDGTGWRFSADGDTLWHTPVSAFDPHGRFALSPSGALFVAGNMVGSRTTGAFTRLSPVDGSVMWQMTAPTPNRWGGPFIAADGRVATALGGYVRWASQDGDSLLQGPDALPPTYSRGAMGADGTIYAAAWDLAAFAPDGTERWRTDLGLSCCTSSASEPVVGADGTIYVATVQGSLVAVNPADGSTRWTQTVGSVGGQPWLALTADGAVLMNAATELHALDAASGAIRWSVTLADRIESSIAVGPDGTIYAITADGRVTAIQGDAALDLSAPWPAWRADNQRTSSVQR